MYSTKSLIPQAYPCMQMDEFVLIITITQILEMQTGSYSNDMIPQVFIFSSHKLTLSLVAIRYELEDYHTYDFIEGAVPWPMAPGKQNQDQENDKVPVNKLS